MNWVKMACNTTQLNNTRKNMIGNLFIFIFIFVYIFFLLPFLAFFFFFNPLCYSAKNVGKMCHVHVSSLFSILINLCLVWASWTIWMLGKYHLRAGVSLCDIASLCQIEFMYILQSLHPIMCNKLGTLSMTAPGWRWKYAEANLPNTPFQNQIYLVRNGLKDTLVSYHVTLWLEYRQAEI